MKSLISKVFLTGAVASMALAPVAAQANTRASSSPILGNTAAMMQSNDDDVSYTDEGGYTSDGRYMQDGRVWSEEAGAWIDAEGNRWLLDDGKWYPLRGKLVPGLFIAALAALVVIAATDDPSSSNGAD